MERPQNLRFLSWLIILFLRPVECVYDYSRNAGAFDLVWPTLGHITSLYQKKHPFENWNCDTLIDTLCLILIPSDVFVSVFQGRLNKYHHFLCTIISHLMRSVFFREFFHSRHQLPKCGTKRDEISKLVCVSEELLSGKCVPWRGGFNHPSKSYLQAKGYLLPSV